MKKQDPKLAKDFQLKSLKPSQLKAIKGGSGDSIIVQDVIDG